MITPLTFWQYLNRRFLVSLLFTIVILSGVILFIDTLELLRKTYEKKIEINILIRLIIYKLPLLIQMILPFALLVSTTICYFNLSKNSELIAARAAGISAWNFTVPAIISSFLLGIFIVTIFNPIVALTLEKQKNLENIHLFDNDSKMFFSESGIWIKDIYNGKLDKIIYAKSLYDRGKFLSEVSVFIAGENFDFIERIEADTATIEDNKILLTDATIYNIGKSSKFFRKTELRSHIIIDHLQENISIPEIISFWNLPNFIEKISNAGFSSIMHKLYFYSLISMPFLLSAVTMIAISFSFSMPRNGKTSFIAFISIIIGFLVYFFIKIISAFALSGSITPFVAINAPIFICFLVSTSAILHYEDG